LGFTIGAEKFHFLALADFGEALREAMGELNRHGHQLFGLVAGKAEHQALVARATGVHTHGDVGRLPLHRANDRTSFSVKAVLGVVIAHLAYRLARDFVVIEVRGRRNFTSDDHQSRGDQRLTGHTPFGVLTHHLVEYGV
jgi:hypothetical protein